MNKSITEISKVQFPEKIMKYFDKIVNKIRDYIKSNINDIDFLEKKLSNLYDYLTNYYSKNNSLNTVPNNNSSLLKTYNYNIPTNFIENYKITKLERKLKQQHEIFQMKELAYLERLLIFQNKLQRIELVNTQDINKYLLSKNNNTLSTEYLSTNNNNSHSLRKSVINTDSNVKKNKKRINIKSASPLSISPVNTIVTSSFSSRKKKEENINNLRTNRKKSAKEGNRSVKIFNRMSNDITANNRFENIFRLKKKKNKKINDSTAVKHDFDDLKKSVEDGRKKLMFIRNSIVPRLYQKCPIK